MTAINAQEQERFVDNMARYAKTHKDWNNLQPEAAVRSVLWVLVSDEGAFDHLCRVWASGEDTENPRRCDRCDGTVSHPAEDRVVDLMAALEQSIAEAKAARLRHGNGSEGRSS